MATLQRYWEALEIINLTLRLAQNVLSPEKKEELRSLGARKFWNLTYFYCSGLFIFFNSNFSHLPRKYMREKGLVFLACFYLSISCFRYFCCFSTEQTCNLLINKLLSFHQKWHTTPQILNMGLTVLKILSSSILTVLLLGIATTRLPQGNNLISLYVLHQLLDTCLS